MTSVSKKKRTVYNTNCCVYGCHSRKGADRKIHFHSFPAEDSGIRVKIKSGTDQEKKMDKRKAWEKLLQMGKPATKYLRVCSKHFTLGDYHLTRGVDSKQPKLKRWAVPSQNLPEKNNIFENSRASPLNQPPKCSYPKQQIKGVKPFETSDTEILGIEPKQPKLKRWAVPSHNLPENIKIVENSRAGPFHRRPKCSHRKQEITDMKLCDTHNEQEQSLPSESRNYYNVLSENERLILNSLMKFGSSNKEVFLFKFDPQAEYFVERKITLSSTPKEIFIEVI